MYNLAIEREHTMSLLQIQLPDDAKQLADEQIARGRFNNISGYIAALIRRDHQEMEDDAVEQLLKERLRSGPSTEMTDGDFDAIRARLEVEVSRRRQA